MTIQKGESPAGTGLIAKKKTDATNVTVAEKIGNTEAELAAAINLLRQPIQDRPREFWAGDVPLMLLDDGGGEMVDRFTDAVAVHHFLIWLDKCRAARAVRDEAQMRRAGFAVVKGGADDLHS
jgi:hypothetical protein